MTQGKIIRFIKNWTLLVALCVGCIVYLTFAYLPPLEPVGDFVGPKLVSLLPVVIFVMLYMTFCKIDMHNFRPRTWHFLLQLVRTGLSGLVVLIIVLFPHADPDTKVVLEGIFICVICPTAAAAAVVTEKLGGSIATMTVYMIIANCFTVVIIPAFFPLVERNANITFLMSAMMVLERVLRVLILPLILGLLTQRLLPRVVAWVKRVPNAPFYLWSFNLSIIMGLATQTLIHSPLHGWAMSLLIFLPLLVCILLFSIGKWVGHFWGPQARIDAGQALGQKNNVVGIWLILHFLNPLVIIAPCAYVVWQNILNALQIWYKKKYGELKW
jgi:BASS family bile acid:Na+ symporter